MPEVLVTGGGGAFEGLAATLMQTFRNGLPPARRPVVDAAVEPETVEEAVEELVEEATEPEAAA